LIHQFFKVTKKSPTLTTFIHRFFKVTKKHRRLKTSSFQPCVLTSTETTILCRFISRYFQQRRRSLEHMAISAEVTRLLLACNFLSWTSRKTHVWFRNDCTKLLQRSQTDSDQNLFQPSVAAFHSPLISVELPPLSAELWATNENQSSRLTPLREKVLPIALFGT
jgi:hypothetical protein